MGNRAKILTSDDWRLSLGRLGLIIFGGTLLLREAFGPPVHGGWFLLYVALVGGSGAMLVVGLQGPGFLRLRVDDDVLVATQRGAEHRLPLGEVTAIRFRSSSRDLGSVTLHSAGLEIEVPWRVRQRALRREIGRRLREHGNVPVSKGNRAAWRWLGQKV